ncbi:alpha/beta hydrolase [Deinococcus malanensis]|uniref:alpha/beta hydrolase n=1 Tax=Deinococcus malanensis TaxID=1706855 RepID=UPI00364412B1
MVLLHGRGGSAQDILTLEQEINLSAFTYLAPQAPGNTWYPYSFLAPVAQNQPHLDQALATVDAVMEELAQQGISAERVVLGASARGLPGTGICQPRRETAGRSRRVQWWPDHAGPRAQPGGYPGVHGVAPDDAHIPLERFRATEAQLRARGAVVDARVIPGLGHSINKDELDAARALMQRVVGQSV